jgi:hypothetical protein
VIDSTMAIETIAVLAGAAALLFGIGLYLKLSYRNAELLGNTMSRRSAGASRRRSTL